jgi:hypothetical protein
VRDNQRPALQNRHDALAEPAVAAAMIERLGGRPGRDYRAQGPRDYPEIR